MPATARSAAPRAHRLCTGSAIRFAVLAAGMNKVEIRDLPIRQRRIEDAHRVLKVSQRHSSPDTPARLQSWTKLRRPFGIVEENGGKPRRRFLEVLVASIGILLKQSCPRADDPLTYQNHHYRTVMNMRQVVSRNDVASGEWTLAKNSRLSSYS